MDLKLTCGLLGKYPGLFLTYEESFVHHMRLVLSLIKQVYPRGIVVAHGDV